ncbi:MAG: hypothetical protein HS122_18475 [Opitutaceae bacterium]|nr:hypothetical protein [Opitutaceae bacterium]
MKTLAIVLILSLVGNALWIVRHFQETAARRGSAVAGAAQEARPGESASTSAGPAESAGGAGNVVLGADGKALSPEVWARLHGGDIRKLVSRLKAAGFPSSAIRAIVMSEVGNLFNERRNALASKSQRAEYWRSFGRSPMDPATVAQGRALEKEYSALVKELLGDLPAETGGFVEALNRRMYGNLSADKVQQIRRITDDYNELSQDVYRNSQGILLAEDRETLAFLEKEKAADLEKLLTPDERMEYELRSSQLANTIRGRLNGFDATEAEYRAIYAAAKTSGMVERPSSMEEGRQSNEAFLNAVKSTLTPERMAEYERSTNPSYANANRLVARLNLPAGTAERLVTIEKDAQLQADVIRRNSTLTADQRTAQLGELSSRTTQQLTGSLGGERGMEAYRQYNGGWLRTLTNQTQPRGAPAQRLPGR